MPRHRMQNPPIPVPRPDRAPRSGFRALVPAAIVATSVTVLASTIALHATSANAEVEQPTPSLSASLVPMQGQHAVRPVKHKHTRTTHSARHWSDEAAETHTGLVSAAPALVAPVAPVAPAADPTLSASASASASAPASPAASASASPSASTSASTLVSSAPVVGVPTIPSGSQLTDAQLIDSVGINIHPDYTGTAYVQNGSADATLQSLLRLGVTNVRTRIDKQPTGYLATFFDQLASHHIGLMGIMGTPDGRWSTYGAGQSAQLLQSVTTGFYRGKVSALEMPNEWDANGGGSWSSDLGTFDKEYLGTMSASGLPIVGASMAQPSGYSSYRSADPTETRNLHPYAGSSMPEASSVLPRWMSASSASSATSDVVATELGYHNALKATNGVSEQTSAAYLLRSLLWNRTHGVARSYIYELFDERPETAQTDREQHFGLVAVTGGSSASGWVQREKPAYTQLRGMLAFLRDTGTATGSPVAYTLSGAPSDLSVVPMLRSDGSTDIAIWRRVPVDANGNSAQAPVSLKFGSNVRTTVYDTATGSVRPLASSAASVDVSASGSVTIVRVAPAK